MELPQEIFSLIIKIYYIIITYRNLYMFYNGRLIRHFSLGSSVSTMFRVDTRFGIEKK